jgi:hypothetical protein
MKFLTDNARWIIGVLVLAVLIAILFSCSGDDRSAQVQQTTRSTEAVASAAADAVSTLEDRTTAEQSIDQAVATATQEIQDAQSAQQVHSAVTSALCSKPAYSNDPACRVR